jgi:hypothetical protein
MVLSGKWLAYDELKEYWKFKGILEIGKKHIITLIQSKTWAKLLLLSQNL